jgi:hypothetical protein
MKTVFLVRTITSDQGTEGFLIEPESGFSCKTLELPWRENKRSISCIPSGEYIVKIRQSPRYGRIYWVTNVPERSWILIHSGNVAGDVEKGFRTHVQGCILLGKKHGILYNQRAVLNSRIIVKSFMRTMNYEPFKLYIVGGF